MKATKATKTPQNKTSNPSPSIPLQQRTIPQRIPVHKSPYGIRKTKIHPLTEKTRTYQDPSSLHPVHPKKLQPAPMTKINSKQLKISVFLKLNPTLTHQVPNFIIAKTKNPCYFIRTCLFL